MFFDRFTDDLTLRRGARSHRPWLAILLGVAVLALAAAATHYYLRHRPAAGQSSWLDERAERAAGRQVLERFRALAAGPDLLAARDAGYEALAQCRDPASAAEIEELLGPLNVKLLLSPAPQPEKEEYFVQPGDSLERIARKFGTTIDLLRQVNQLKRDRIHPGDRLQVFKGVLTLAVSKTRNTMLLEADGRFFKRYRVGTGQYGKTPVGTFQIADKIKDPPWWRPDGKMIPFGDPDNVLGTRWMSILPVEGTPPVSGFGIHGTWEPETIGRQASAGCIRLLNSEVEELFILVPVGARVVIAE